MTIRETVTGTTGNAVQDGTARGSIALLLNALTMFVVTETGWLSDEQALTLAPIVTGLAFILGGLWDRFLRPSA